MKRKKYYITREDFRCMYRWVEKNNLSKNGIDVFGNSIYQRNTCNVYLSFFIIPNDKFIRASIKFLESLFGIKIVLKESDCND